MDLQDRAVRVSRANTLIYVISLVGREFFRHKADISNFEMDDRGRIWFRDSYSKKRIYMHSRYSRWRGFTNGGTLQSFIKALVKYIMTGNKPQLNLGPWPNYLCNGDLWGYGDSMDIVRKVAEQL